MPSCGPADDPRVMAVKGVPRGAALIGTPTAVDVSQGGKKLRRGIKVFSVAVGIAKLEFYNNLRKSADVARTASPPSLPGGASSICPRSTPSSCSNSAPSS
jgi:phage terminase large subunit GpA-like protein